MPRNYGRDFVLDVAEERDVCEVVGAACEHGCGVELPFLTPVTKDERAALVRGREDED